MINQDKIVKWIRTTIAVSVVVVILGGIIKMRLELDHYKELYSQIHPGMSKSQIEEIVGEPMWIRSTRLNRDVYYYKVPAGFSESPRCYFLKGDSILVRFAWDAITVDTSLVIDSTKDSH